MLGDDTGGELLRRHFEREEADDAAVDGRRAAVGLHLAAIGMRHVVGDVGGERGFAHAGAAGHDDQVGLLQPAHFGIEVLQPRRDPGELAVALEGAGRHVDRGGERLREALEARTIAIGFGEFVEPALGVLDLLARREIDRSVERDVDHVLADPDQVAAQGEVGNGAAVVRCVDDRRRLGREAGEILADVEAADVDVGGQEGLQRDRRRHLAGADEVGGNLVDLLVQRLMKLRRVEKIGNPVERLVVDQDGAKQRLLGLDVMGRAAILRCGDVSELSRCRIDGCHDLRSKKPDVSKIGNAVVNEDSRTQRYIVALSETALCLRTYGVAPRGTGRARCLTLSAIPTVRL